ncbi:MAG: type IX secretion system sortase PorU [candidate division Zixibacteria bacterium]|nr:type IX secretion system sortase PorU [candidate division Zixibacteria bacterium]MDD4918044.1 type IX secretion system sortase PorU [candidate division Zixibacteria bacterium]
MDIRLYRLLLLSTFALILSLPVAASADGVNLVYSDRTGLHAVVTVDPERLESAVEADSLPGYYRLLMVGVPFGAEVELASADAHSRSVRPVRLTDGRKMSRQARPLVEVSEPFTVRGRQMVTVRVNPAGPDGGCADSIDVRLTFRGGLMEGAAPRDPWFDRVFGERVVNYREFRTWPAPEALKTKAAAPGPFAAGETWYKITVNRTGLCRVTGSQLQQAGLELSGLASDALCLFNAGGRRLPLNNATPRPEFRQAAITVDDGGDGRFDAADAILFFADAGDRWVYAPATAPFWENNPYETKNVYWLTVREGQGVRMATETVDPSAPADTTITTFTRVMHLEQDNLLKEDAGGAIDDYYIWYWTTGPTVQLSAPSVGPAPGTSAQLYCRASTRDPDVSPEIGYVTARVNGAAAAPNYQNQFHCSFRVDNLTDGLNTVNLTMWGADGVLPYLDYVELTYQSFLAPLGGVLDVPLGGFEGTARLEAVDNFSGDLAVLRLDDPGRPVRLAGYTRAAGTIAFTAALAGEGPNRFYLAETAGAFGPLGIERSTPADLYAIGEQTDMIIVTSRQLVPALAEYVERAAGRGISSRVVAVEDIMENFSFGMYDPTAIRDYLKYAYENYPSPPPHTVLLAGDGSFDYTNALGTGVPNVVPPYIRPDDRSAADDNYVYFGRYGILDSDTSYILVGDRGLDMMVARWPVQTAGEIATIVEKSRRYETSAALGLWRSVITVVADDEVADNQTSETFHVEQAEELLAGHVPRTLHQKKIYLYDFPRVGREKPGANDAIVRQINEGAVVVDYIGHGNPDVWAHEHVFWRDRDIPRLSNSDRLPLFFAASCAIGAFDDPAREAMAEELVVYPNGGGIAVISAMREVWSTQNADLNQKVFDLLLTTDSLTIAEALYMGKLERQYNGGSVPYEILNDRCYEYFGDPLVRLGLPRLRIAFDNPPDSLVALGRSTIAGRVLDREGRPVAADGRLVIEAYDSERERQYRLASGNVVSYRLTGPAIYRGTATIRSGEFEFAFVTPLDVGYGGTGAQIMTYAELAGTDGVGVIDSLSIAAAVDTTHRDETGPEIAYGFVHSVGFSDGGTVATDDVLRVTLADSSGINLTGGLGHGITLVLDDRSETMADLTDRFACDQDDYTRGQLEYPLAGLSPGRHTFKIKAWDNANNSATAAFTATVAAAGGPALVDLLNYPNPMRERTRFYYRLTTAVERVCLEIFTLAGRRIWVHEEFPTDPGYYDDIEWYGTDFAGDRVATGVYVYKATAYPRGGAAVETFGKVVVVN